MHHQTASDAIARVLSARAGSLPATASLLYLIELRDHVNTWLTFIDLEIEIRLSRRNKPVAGPDTF